MVKKLSKGKVAGLIIFSVVVLVIVIVAVIKIVDYINDKVDYINDTENRNFYNYVYSEMSKLYDNVELGTSLVEDEETSGYRLSTLFRVEKNYPTEEKDKNHFLREAADLRKICIKYSEQHRDEKFGKITRWAIVAFERSPYYDVIFLDKDYDEKFSMEEDKAYDSISLRDLDKIRIELPEVTLSDLRYFSDCKQIITYSLFDINSDCDFSEFENLRCFACGVLIGGYAYTEDFGNSRKLEEKVLSNLPKGCRYFRVSTLIGIA